MKSIGPLVCSMLLCAVSVACAVEDIPGGEASGQEAQEIAALALVDYVACEAARAEGCASEREELEAALEILESVRDVVEFRVAAAVADCAGGTTVTCNGDSCMAKDNVGCACSSGGTLSSVAVCASS